MKKRHHYVPQFYLKRFCQDEKLHAFSKKTRQFVPKTKISNLMVKSHLYSIDNEGSKNAMLEDALGNLENSCLYLFDKLDKQEALTDEDFSTMMFYLALQRSRTASALKRIQQMSQVASDFVAKTNVQLINEAKTAGNNTVSLNGKEVDISWLPSTIDESSVATEIDPDMAKINFLKHVDPVARELHKLNWTCLTIKNKDIGFITTDYPVYAISATDYPTFIKGWGVGTEGVTVFYPIGPKTILIGTKKATNGIAYTEEYFKKKKIKHINALTYLAADDQVCSAELPWIKKAVSLSKNPRYFRIRGVEKSFEQQVPVLGLDYEALFVGSRF